MTPLSPKKRSALRAEAHKLNPIVIIGDKGLTDEVIAEIDRSLEAHELIKVRAATGERDARDVWLETICQRLQAHPVQQIGKVFVVYREKPKEKPQKAPEKKSGPRLRGDDTTPKDTTPKDTTPKGASTRTSRPRSRTPSPRPASGPPRRRPRTSR